MDDRDQDPLQSWINRINQQEKDGTLTYHNAPINTYLKLTTGPHRGHIVLKTHPHAQIDNKDITWFLPSLTWIWISTIKDSRCHRVSYGEHPDT